MCSRRAWVPQWKIIFRNYSVRKYNRIAIWKSFKFHVKYRFSKWLLSSLSSLKKEKKISMKKHGNYKKDQKVIQQIISLRNRQTRATRKNLKMVTFISWTKIQWNYRILIWKKRQTPTMNTTQWEQLTSQVSSGLTFSIRFPNKIHVDLKPKKSNHGNKDLPIKSNYFEVSKIVLIYM